MKFLWTLKGLDREDCEVVSYLFNFSNETSIGFILPNITANDTGNWTVTMIRIDSDFNSLRASKSLSLLVTRPATTHMVVSGPSDNVVSLNQSYVEVETGAEVSVKCSAAGGRPEVDMFLWTLNESVWASVEYSEIIFSNPDPLCIVKDCR